MHSSANKLQQVTTQLPGNTTQILLLGLSQWSCVNCNTCEFPHKSPVWKNKRISSELEDSVPYFSHGPSSLLCYQHVFLCVCFLSSSLFTCFLFLCYFHLFVLYPTCPRRSAICLSRSVSLYLTVSPSLLLLAMLAMLLARALWFHHPLFSLSTYERVCNKSEEQCNDSECCVSWFINHKRSGFVYVRVCVCAALYIPYSRVLKAAIKYDFCKF